MGQEERKQPPQPRSVRKADSIKQGRLVGDSDDDYYSEIPSESIRSVIPNSRTWGKVEQPDGDHDYNDALEASRNAMRNGYQNLNRIQHNVDSVDSDL